jgi:hypothetical protein
LKKLIYFTGSRTRDVPVCSKVPQPLCYRVAEFFVYRMPSFVMRGMWLLLGPTFRRNISPPSSTQKESSCYDQPYRKCFSAVWFSLVVTVNVPSSLIFHTLKMEGTLSSETLVRTRPTRRSIPEDDILNSYSRQNHKSYISTYLTKFY